MFLYAIDDFYFNIMYWHITSVLDSIIRLTYTTQWLN